MIDLANLLNLLGAAAFVTTALTHLSREMRRLRELEAYLDELEGWHPLDGRPPTPRSPLPVARVVRR